MHKKNKTTTEHILEELSADFSDEARKDTDRNYAQNEPSQKRQEFLDKIVTDAKTRIERREKTQKTIRKGNKK